MLRLINDFGCFVCTAVTTAAFTLREGLKVYSAPKKARKGPFPLLDSIAGAAVVGFINIRILLVSLFVLLPVLADRNINSYGNKAY